MHSLQSLSAVTLIATAAIALPVFSIVSPQNPSPEPAVLTFPSGYGVASFQILDPEAKTSSASRLNHDRADMNGLIPSPTEGYTLTNQVMVVSDQVSLLHELVSAVDSQAEVLVFPVQGVHLVQTATVAKGVVMALALEPVFGYGTVHLNVQRPIALRSLPSDPLFGDQWHLVNTQDPLNDANADAAWNRGYTGAGVTIGIVDAGSAWFHEDLAAHYNPAGSTSSGASDHGTAVAGVAAAIANNGKGGVGMAYDSAWCNLHYGDAATTALNLAHANDINDIKNNSWGPFDDGTLWTMSPTEMAALVDSVATGRGGLGEVFVWAAGNGSTIDRVDYDPYASSRYTIAIGGIGDMDVRSNFNESGSTMFAVTQSAGNVRKITTTYTSGYTSSFGGSSSSAPLASGQVALMLQANPNLTWRDVQHVLAHGARMVDPGHSNWAQNGAGHDINYNYGFGALDADVLVQLAAGWINVSPELTFDSGEIAVNQAIPDDDPQGLEFTINVPDNFRTEHIEVILNATHGARGQLKIWVKSPDGTRSLLTKVHGETKDDLVDYVFTSLRSWDEFTSGDWVIHISDETLNSHGVLQDYRLKLYGNDGAHLEGFRVSAVGDLVPGTQGSISVSGARPGEDCWAVYSITGLGSYPLPQLGLDLDIDSPILIGMRAQPDAAGNASFSRGVPPLGSAGLDIWFQAFQLNSKTSVVASVIQ